MRLRPVLEGIQIATLAIMGMGTLWLAVLAVRHG